MDLGGGIDPLHGEGQFVGAGDGLDDDVFALHTRREEGLFTAGDKSVNYGGVPAGVDDGDAEGGAIVFLGGPRPFEGCHGGVFGGSEGGCSLDYRKSLTLQSWAINVGVSSDR